MADSSVPDNYASRIKRLRTELDLTQSELADRMGVSFASVNRWENEQTKPSALAWQRIALAEKHGIDALSATFSPATTASEAAAPYGAGAPPARDFSADAETVRLVAEAERLRYGHLVNPAFATEIARIDPLPHQRLAVYERMLHQPRLRFFLADDAGAGKTIMTGLYIREMLARRLVRRILIVPPAGLIGNWERELRTLFNLRFRVVVGADAKKGNPFAGASGNHVIVSVDTLGGERMFARLGEAGVEPYDLVVFDEAHKLSVQRDPDGTVRPTDRYRLAEALAGAEPFIDDGDGRWRLPWSANHLLLLTATPHQGKDFPYFCLWRLLEPQVLSTESAFKAFPTEARKRFFIRRTKEEMVKLDGTRLYPERVSDTLSYDLQQGPNSEQELYDRTTDYISTYYNRARILNRTAARFAMAVFQRRLASSTFALLCSFERRLARLDDLIEKIRSGQISPDQLAALQRKLEETHDVLDEMTADEESTDGEQEENEVAEEKLLSGVVAVSLTELKAERDMVKGLLDLARRVNENESSKFQRLREVMRDPRWQDEKFLIFTEHRDTLTFLTRRLEGLGFAGQIASIHGGMDYKERETQVEHFRKPVADGGARYMVCTDAAAEGINLQFCWVMANFDIPWNPARLEQRMGRIHRYKQEHNPVIIVNIVAGKTREGRVLKILLDKLEKIRKELGSDKVFDVIGRLYEGVSMRDYMMQALSEDGAKAAEKTLASTLTKEQVEALAAREKTLYGEGGDVKKELPRLQASVAQEAYFRLLPGYVRRLIEKAVPRLDLSIEGDIDGVFSLRPLKPGMFDPLWSAFEVYPPELVNCLTLQKAQADAIFLHPGEPFFERFREYLLARFSDQAQRGAVFVDPVATEPYLFHLALVPVVRRADSDVPPLAQPETMEYRLVGLRQTEHDEPSTCSVEQLLLLRGGQGVPSNAYRLVERSGALTESAAVHLRTTIGKALAETHSDGLFEELPAREEFIGLGFDYQEAELAATRARLTPKAREGNPRAVKELGRIKASQALLTERKQNALEALRREPELVGPGEIEFLAHALVVPSSDPADVEAQDKEIEAIAMLTVRAYEEALDAKVRDVSTPEKARAAGLMDFPGFDLISDRPAGVRLNIEVKGRATRGEVILSENEWVKACNLRGQYWLYVVFECASPKPWVLRVNDPFGKLFVRTKSVAVDAAAIMAAAEQGD
ncbi:MAG TPA: helicase-related protein [Planctomycetota bacterium]|jgi:transcriptional regulator with XRE-family HTH domain